MTFRKVPQVALAALLAFSTVPATVAVAQDQDTPAAEAPAGPPSGGPRGQCDGSGPRGYGKGAGGQRGNGPGAGGPRGGGPRGGAFLLQRFDTDNDGSLTIEEFAAVGERPIAQADADGDGVITADEIDAALLSRMVQNRRERIIERFDLNGDGKVEVTEIERLREKRFSLMDRNDDGKVDADELRLAREFMGGPQRQGKGHHGRGGPRWQAKGGDCGPGRGWHGRGGYGGQGPRGPGWQQGQAPGQPADDSAE